MTVQTRAPLLRIYARTPAEHAAGVIPTNYSYLPGDVRRYAVLVGDGTALDQTPISDALSVDQAVYLPKPSNKYLVTGLSTTFGANKIEGDGINTRIDCASAAHTLSVLTGDADLLIGDLWIDQSFGSGSWDAINIATTETRIRNVDIDDAPRYGIYVGGFRTQIEQVQMQGVVDTGIFILSTATLNSISDVNFVIAGAKVPGKCIDVQSDFNTINGVIADQCIGYVLNLAGDWNSVSSVTARQPGGATANDFIRVGGAFNTVAGATCDNTTGVSFLVSGNSNALSACASSDSSGIGASITGTDNSFSGRVFNAGAGSGTVHGISITGNNNTVDANVQTSSGDDLNITGDSNTVRGSYEGAVVLTSTANRNTLEVNCGTLTTTASGTENTISAVCSGTSGTIATVASNSNTVLIRVTIGGTIGCRVSGDNNVGTVSSFGNSDTAIEIDGANNALTVYASGANGEEMRIGGSHNVISGHITGDVIVEGDTNVILARITGNLTFNNGADNNDMMGSVGGTVTDNGSGNVHTSSTTAINDLSDVTISSVAAAEVLQWSGSAWINRTFAEASIGDMNDLVDDTTPQLGGNLDAQSKDITTVASLTLDATFKVEDGTNTDDVSFSHDGTDFNIAGTTTTDINITGITAIQAGTVDADFDAITATSYGGITEANLVDKAAAESLSGNWTWSGYIRTSSALYLNNNVTIQCRNQANNAWFDFAKLTTGDIFSIDGEAKTVAFGSDVKADGVIELKEQATANSNTAAYGQLWVKTASPNQLWFTDDAGADTQLA